MEPTQVTPNINSQTDVDTKFSAIADAINQLSDSLNETQNVVEQIHSNVGNSFDGVKSKLDIIVKNATDKFKQIKNLSDISSQENDGNNTFKKDVSFKIGIISDQINKFKTELSGSKIQTQKDVNSSLLKFRQTVGSGISSLLKAIDLDSTNLVNGYVIVWDTSMQKFKLAPQSVGGSTTLTSDVTGTGTGTIATTIANGAVTNAKMANMTTKTYKGRTSALTGVSEDVPVATLKSDLALNNVDNTSDATQNASVSTLTNKTVTSPKFTAYDALKTIAGATILELGYYGTPVNYVGVETAEAGGNPVIYAAGVSTNIGFQFVPKGTGRLQVGAGLILTNISSDTVTNKRITKRVVITTQSATPAINTDNTDISQITGLAQSITSMTTGLTGTPVAGDMLMIQFTDNGTARAITFGASFASTTVTLPTTTVASTMLRVLFQRNNANTFWDCIATV